MGRKINFILGFHIHQPVGNFDSVFERATNDCYRPLLEAMHGHPQIPFALHISGPVWEYFEENHRDIFEKISAMVDRGQCELLGGGFYEPILTVIPREDAIGQIEKMADFLDEKFSYRPDGIWLTERIWEPHLPALLSEAGIKFLAVDDYHLKAVGISGNDLLGYFITEENGKTTAIFPISEFLRYTIPFADVEKTLRYLISIADDEEERLVVFADDGEKFGLWPGTKKWVWQEGWMEKFLTALDENSEWINIISFSDALVEIDPKDRIYLPTGSYFEMSEWTLPADMSYKFHRWVEELKREGKLEELRPFVKGGFWRNFLAKYPESNWMHKRMLWISQQLRSKRRRIGKKVDEARISLYRSQCNCAYWHGVFGGLYLPHLREGVWTNILKAESIIEREAPSRAVVKCDVDADGMDEIRISNGETVMWVVPHRGGAVREISFLPTQTNMIDTLARHREGYHKLLWEAQHSQNSDEHASIHDRIVAKEKGLTEILHYDSYFRSFAMEHFLLTFTTIDEMEQCKYIELGDFVDGAYNVEKLRKVRGDTEIVLHRDGAIRYEGQKFPVSVTKKILLQSPGSHIIINYEIENKSTWREFLFGVETNYSLLSRDDPSRYFLFPHETLIRVRPGDRKTYEDVDGYELVDESRGFRISCRSRMDKLWLFPVETVSNSECGFERLYQETSVIHLYRFNLDEGDRISIDIMWKLESV